MMAGGHEHIKDKRLELYLKLSQKKLAKHPEGEFAAYLAGMLSLELERLNLEVKSRNPGTARHTKLKVLRGGKAEV